jgi:cation/acetate symporter
LIKKQLKPDISEKGELLAARISILVAILIAGLFGIYPPGFVAAVVALAFGLAAASFFPAIVLGIFDKRMNKEGAVSGMIVGIVLMLFYMIRFKTGLVGFMDPRPATEWWFGTSPEGFGTVAMTVNVIIAITVSRLTAAPPKEVQEIVENIRIPSGVTKAQSH